jgi:hypothetical protein
VNEYLLNSAIEFGSRLIETRDLDPLYCALAEAPLDREQLKRWLLAYWCFYHVGVASFLSERTGSRYWDTMRLAAENKPLIGLAQKGRVQNWPRGTERRHFRGPVTLDAVNALQERGTEWVDVLSRCESVREIERELETVPLFGPWIAFKIGDMLERIVDGQCKIGPDLLAFYKEPRKMLNMIAEGHGEQEAVALSRMLEVLVGLDAPPKLDRKCGPAELETICCKFKSSLKGHYRIGKDIADQTSALRGWGDVAQEIAQHYPPQVGNDLF